MSTQLQDNFKLVAPKSLDSRYLDINSVPYTSIAAANTAISSIYRYRGLTVNINGTEYWYRAGTADLDLVIKSAVGTLDSVIEAGNSTTRTMNTGAITAAGNVSLLAVLQMRNGNWAQWRNVADTGYLNVLRLDTANRVNLGSQVGATALHFFSTGTTTPAMTISTLGRVNVGGGSADCILDASDGRDAIRMPGGTTLQRPAVFGPGYIRYNSSTDKMEYSNASTWNAIVDNLAGGTQNVIATSYTGLRGNTSPVVGYIYFVTTARKQGAFYYDNTDTSSPDNDGTILVSTNGSRFKRIYDYFIDADWFGCIPDYALSGVSTMTGTANQTALNAALAAARDNEQVVLGFGNYYFSGPIASWVGTKTMNLLILANTYHNSVNFLSMIGGATKFDRFVHTGRAIGKEGIPVNSRAAFLTSTQPVWSAFTGNFITIRDVQHKHVQLNYVEGFRSAVRFEAVLGSFNNSVHFTYFNKNAIGIELVSIDGSSYCDSIDFYGGRISGGTALIIDGYQPYINGSSQADPYNGAFRNLNFYNILFDLLENMMLIRGEVTEATFHRCHFEGGLTTGTWGPTRIHLRTSVADAHALAGSDNFCRNVSFVSCSPMTLQWFTGSMGAPGRRTQWIGTPLWAGSDPNVQTYIGYGGISNDSGEVWVYPQAPVSSATRATMPVNVFVFEPQRPNKIQTVTATTTVTTGVRFVYCNNTTSIQLSMPSPNNHYDCFITIKRINSGAVTIFAADALRSQSDNSLASAGSSVTYYSPPGLNRWDMINKL